ncbi:RND efflux system outer membrane lipoprotein [Caballeronia terrestris]|uniref:RND efflux system outer membrane lipoprotein n=1 Tax=Caballeronia terrestris TaxID=1226301 RepID=A0A158L679_9BURK|nr:RND efflux system outer membrane lipoprotein [Caballeronia terrestris]
MLEGLRAQADAQRYALLAAYLTLTANVVNTMIARAAYSEEILRRRAKWSDFCASRST